MAWNEPGDDKNKRPNGDQNDPWGGNKNNQQPPDLDKILSDFFNRLGGLFGGSKRPANGSSQNGGAGALLLGLVVACIAYGVWGFTTIVDGEQGILQQFGKYKTTVNPGPTFVFKPFQRLTVVNVQNVNKVDNSAEIQSNREMLTKDENIIIIKYEVQFNISNARDYVFNVNRPVDTLRQAAESAIREIIGRNNLNYIISKGRDTVALQAKADIQAIVDAYQTGIRVRNVNLTEAQFPKEVQAAIDDVTKAREDRERFISEAQAYSNQVVPEARGHAVKMIEESKGYRVQVVKKAEGESSRFNQLLSEYKKAPEVTRDRLYLDSVERVLSNSGKVVIDSKGKNMLYLPLDKLSSSSPVKSTGTLSDVIKQNDDFKRIAPVAGSQLQSGSDGSLNSRLRERSREIR